MQKALTHNNRVLYKLLTIQAISMAAFTAPIIVAYFQLRGVDLAGFFLVQGCFRLMVVACEIPAGYIADRWDRSQVITVALTVWFIGNVILVCAHNFIWLLTANLVFAITAALISGTLEAYIYDILEQKNRTSEAERWIGRLHASSYTAEGGSSILGAILFAWWPVAPAVAQATAASISMLLAYTLPNIPRKKRSLNHSHWQEVKRIIKWSLYDHLELKWLILFPAILFAGSVVFFWSIQIMLLEKNVEVVWIGWAISTVFISKIVFALGAEYLLKSCKGGGLILLLLASFSVGGGLLALPSNPWFIYLGGIVGAGFVHAFSRPMFISFVSQRTKPDERVTALSVMRLISMLLGAFWLAAAQPLMEYGNINMGGYILLTVFITLLLILWPAIRLYQLRLLEPIKQK
ncbi:MAG: MFS transporter [Alphaproteobacteria bacterium]|nr:MFS transporter [Alphaproteobacteria bacterium]MDD9919799.1 MFS transporter [Alphaproteobacteria bacterium]